MFPRRLFGQRPAKAAGEALYVSAAGQARQPAFYIAMRTPDTREGRFELYTLHTILIWERLKGQGPAATETAQAAFDAYLRGLDDAFRELGVGDLSVGKKMKKLGEAFYGRLKSYEEAEGAAGLEALFGRILPEADAGQITSYVVTARDHLATQPLENLLAGKVSWPVPH
jgi:cytochrome b pre-mRNA-processing protein 3